MTDERIGVLLVDRHQSYRLALTLAFASEPDFSIRAQVGSLTEATALLADRPGCFPVVVCELELPDGPATTLVKIPATAARRRHFVALTAIDDRWSWAQAMASGFSGVISKEGSLDEIRSAICRAGRGQPVHEPQDLVELLRMVTERQAAERSATDLAVRLTPREYDILHHLATGASDKEIAEAMGISTNTVAAHMVHILRKMSVHSRLQAVILALKYGMVSLDANA